MKDGVHAETPADRLQNKLRGVGSLMRREGFSLEDRLFVARTVFDMLKDPRFATIKRNYVFASFFALGELSERDHPLPPL